MFDRTEEYKAALLTVSNGDREMPALIRERERLEKQWEEARRMQLAGRHWIVF
jgi:hypothetical protein